MPLVRSAAMALTLILCAVISSEAAAQSQSFFNTRETQRFGFGEFPKWRKTLADIERDRAASLQPCGQSGGDGCRLQEWRTFLGGLSGLDRETQIDEVNDWVNDHPYIEDPNNWGRTDYWAAPSEFLTRSGDCEDFAIMKYFSLRELGIPEDDMRLVVLMDTNLNLLHAVLVVRNEGVWYSLDNQTSSVVAADRMRHYVPYYSINANAYWVHTR